MEWVASVALVAGIAVVHLLAIRRVARGDRRFIWLYFAPILAMMAYALWIVLGTWGRSPVVAAGLGLFLAATLVLLVRMVRSLAAVDGGLDGILDRLGELRGPLFDYIVWGAIAPMLIVALLLVLLVTGGLTTGR